MKRLVVLALAASAIACGGQVSGTPGGDATEEGPGTLRMTLTANDGSAWGDFGLGVIGQRNARELVLTMAHEGGGAVTLEGSPSITGAAAADYFIVEPPTYSVLRAGESAEMTIGYRPRGEGAREAVVSIASDAATPVDPITLQGTGACPTAPPVDLEAPGMRESCTTLVYVAGGNKGFRMRSLDTVTWTDKTYTLPADAPLADMYDNGVSAIMFGAGRVVAVADAGFYLSDDGAVTWRRLPSPLPQDWGQGSHSTAGIFANGKFVVLAGSRSYTSYDGETWQIWQQTYPMGQGSPGHWAGIAYGNGSYVAVGDSWSQVSEDGEVWHDAQRHPVTGSFSDIAYGHGKFIAVGDDCCSAMPYPGKGRRGTTLDGITWTNEVFNATPGATSISGSTFIAFKDDVFYISYDYFTATTEDSLTLTPLNEKCGTPPNQFNASRPGHIEPTETIFLGASYRGSLSTSPDARCWKSSYVTASTDPYSPGMARAGRVLK